MNDSETQKAQTRIQKHHQVSWVDVENPTDTIFAQLEANYHLHPVHLEESIQKIQLTKVEREANYLFLLLHVPVQRSMNGKMHIQQIGIFLGKNYLVTIHEGPSDLIEELFEIFEKSEGHKAEYSKKGPGYLLYGIVKNLLDKLTDMSQSVSNELDVIEDLVYDNSGSDAYQIGKVSQKIVKLRRTIGPLRFLLDDLAQQIHTFTGGHLSRHYANNTKAANKLWENIEEAKETVEIYKDTDFKTSTEQTNKILMVLTLVFTFTIPITVVGMLYGINVPLPGGTAAGAWTFLGPYTTFEILASVSVLGAIIMYIYFKAKRWF